MSKVCVFDHPLIQHKLSILRDENTGVRVGGLVTEIAMLMCYEATRDLPLEEVDVEHPVAVAKCKRISGKKLAVSSILRAGLGMVDEHGQHDAQRQGWSYRAVPAILRLWSREVLLQDARRH